MYRFRERERTRPCFGSSPSPLSSWGCSSASAELAAPDCRDAAGTAHDSGYPCRIDRSSGKTEYAFSKTTTITVPYARQLMIGLLIVGVVGVAITRRR